MMRRKRNENENRNMNNEKTFQVPVAWNGFSIPRSEWNFHVVNFLVEKKEEDEEKELSRRFRSLLPKELRVKSEKNK